MMFKVCFRNVPPIGLGIIPLLVTFASPVHTSATLFLEQTLHNIPKTSFKTMAPWFLFFDSLKNLVRLLITRSLMSSFFDSIKSEICFAIANWCCWLWATPKYIFLNTLFQHTLPQFLFSRGLKHLIYPAGNNLYCSYILPLTQNHAFLLLAVHSWR